VKTATCNRAAPRDATPATSRSNHPELPDRIFRQSVAQDEPLPGSLQPEYRTCGKPTCRCFAGPPHGPYWYRRWREGGRQRRAYVPASDLPRVRAAIDQWHRLHPPLWPVRRLLMTLALLQRAAGGLR